MPDDMQVQDATWRRVLLRLINRQAFAQVYVPYGLHGAILLGVDIEARPGESIELELAFVEELMVFHIRGVVVPVPDEYADRAGALLHLAPFDRSARDIIVDFAQGKNLQELHRRERRFPLKMTIEYTDRSDFISVVVSDISGGGAFIESEDAPPVGTLVVLRLPLPDGDEPLVVRAEVVWRGGQRRKGFGVQFMMGESSKLERLSRWIVSMRRGVMGR